MGYGAPVHRRRPCPYCCGGQLWMVTRGFFGCGSTGSGEEAMVAAEYAA